MSDLISRQDAIDMFQNLAYDDWNQGVSTTWANAYSEAAEMIRDLPSAQPEIIRCKDCKYNYGLTHGGEFNPDDIVCTFFDTDGIQYCDFCSYAERKTDEQTN